MGQVNHVPTVLPKADSLSVNDLGLSQGCYYVIV